MLKIYIDDHLDLSSANWVRAQSPVIDAVIGCVTVLSSGIDNGCGWILIEDDEVCKLSGLNYRIQADSSALPEIVITSIVSDKPGSIIKTDFSDIMCPVGSQLTCMAELRAQDGSVIPLTDTFKMPLKSRDNRERFVFVAFESGIATFSGTMNESGLWSINQQAINSGLPVEQHMTIKEVLIYVCI